jgi:DNA-binding response OmpR family regulator
MQNDFSNLTLLYVEDDEIIRQNAVEYLSSYFKEVFQAEDGRVALEIYKSKKPNIIISDIKMPKLNGLEMAKEIRKKDKETPIIIATAFTDTNYLLEAVELQLIKYIKKPISSKKLKEALKLVWEHLHLNNIVKLSSSSFYDNFNKTLFIDEVLIKLTTREHQLLDLLAKNHHRVVNYAEIENILWYDDSMSKDALRALVRTLRIKLQGDYIENVSGFGYRLKVDMS